MDYESDRLKSKRRLEHTLGTTKTSWGAWDRQIKGNLKSHPLHLQWIEGGVMPNLVEDDFDIQQFQPVDPAHPDDPPARRIHPNVFRIEALRGEPVRYVDPRWAPRGQDNCVYELLIRREQEMCDSRYKDYVSALDKERRSFTPTSDIILNNWRITVDDKTWQKMESTP